MFTETVRTITDNNDHSHTRKVIQRFKNDVLNEFKMIIGHWSTLGYYEKNNFVSIDTGCAWGKKLTAIELKKNKKVKRYQVTC